MEDMPVAAPMTAEAGRPGRHAGGHHARACGNGQRAAAASVLAAESVARRVQAAAAIARCGFS